MNNTLYIPLENENTTIIFIDLEFLYQQPAALLSKFKRQINDLHMRCFNVEMIRYSGTLVLATATVIRESDDLNFILVNSPEIISSMAILYVENNRGQLWSVCSSINGQARQLSRLIIQQCQLVLNTIYLFVDYFNPYWNKAVGLYTSLGFRKPQNVVYQGKERLYLEWNRTASSIRKGDIREQATKLKVDYCLGIGYNVAVLTFTREQLATLRNFTTQYREYGAGIGVEILNGSGRAVNYRAKSLGNFHVGNFIIDPIAYVSTKFNSMYSFHTHPNVYVNMIQSILNPPSPQDLVTMFNEFTNGVLKHFVIENNGVWTIQVDPKSMKVIHDLGCGQMSSIGKTLKKRLNVLETNWGEILEQAHGQVNDLLKNTLINNYLADLNNITWKSLGLRLVGSVRGDQGESKDAVPVMLVNYYSWDYVNSSPTWEDWTYFIPCNTTYILENENSISLDFNYADFKPILDAIDHVGKLDVAQCRGEETDALNTFEDFKNTENCIDRWDGRELTSFMLARDPNNIVEKIYNGEI